MQHCMMNTYKQKMYCTVLDELALCNVWARTSVYSIFEAAEHHFKQSQIYSLFDATHSFCFPYLFEDHPDFNTINLTHDTNSGTKIHVVLSSSALH